MIGLRSIVIALLTASTVAPTAPLRVRLAARSFQPGELVVVSIAGARSNTPISVKAFDRNVNAYLGDDGEWRALVGIDLDAKPGTYSIVVTAGNGSAKASAEREEVTRELRVRPKAFPTRRLKVDPNFVTP